MKIDTCCNFREKRNVESFYSSARRCTPSLWCAPSLPPDSSGEGAAPATEAEVAGAGEGGAAVQEPLRPELPLLSAQEKKVPPIYPLTTAHILGQVGYYFLVSHFFILLQKNS